jgi:hypothetical protein
MPRLPTRTAKPNVLAARLGLDEVVDADAGVLEDLEGRRTQDDALLRGSFDGRDWDLKREGVAEALLNRMRHLREVHPLEEDAAPPRQRLSEAVDETNC